MRVILFSATSYDRLYFMDAAQRTRHEVRFLETRLEASTAGLASGFPAVCAFVNDRLDRACIETLAQSGVRLIALRCAGYNNVDLQAAHASGMAVARVPAYSPYAVAEHTLALILSLNRKIHRAYNRTREGNFSLAGLLGFDIHGKTVGIVGTGQIGARVAGLFSGFGCRILAFDPVRDLSCQALGVAYVSREELLASSDILTLHCPLTPQTLHFVDEPAIQLMKRGAMLVNTSRGAVVDTRAVISALKSGRIGSFAMDVYEEEGDLFFRDLSDKVIQDDVLARLMTFPNVLITGHQAFFTHEALAAIASTTLGSIGAFEATGTLTSNVAVHQ